MPRVARRETGECEWRELITWLERSMALRGYKYGPADLSRDTGIALSTLSGLFNCRHRPSLETLTRLARHFREPLANLQRLAGQEVPPGEPEITSPDLTLNLDWRRLTPEQQDAVRAMIRHYLSTRRPDGNHHRG